jgi:hypothetical protein
MDRHTKLSTQFPNRVVPGVVERHHSTRGIARNDHSPGKVFSDPTYFIQRVIYIVEKYLAHSCTLARQLITKVLEPPIVGAETDHPALVLDPGLGDGYAQDATGEEGGGGVWEDDLGNDSFTLKDAPAIFAIPIDPGVIVRQPHFSLGVAFFCPGVGERFGPFIEFLMPF